MSEFEKVLENNRPDIQVPNFQRNLRRELLLAGNAPSVPIWGYLAAFSAGALVTFFVLFIFMANKSEVRSGMASVGQSDFRQNTPLYEVAPVDSNAPTYHVGTNNTAQALDELMGRGALSSEYDRQFATDWARQRFNNPNWELQPIGNEEVLSVREFRTNTGKRIRVYTNLLRDENPPAY